MGDVDISFDSIDSDLAGGVNPVSNLEEPMVAAPNTDVVVLNQQNTLRSTQRPSQLLSPDLNESRTVNISSVTNVNDVAFDNDTERLVSRSSKGRSPITGTSTSNNTPVTVSSSNANTPEILDSNGNHQCTRIDKKINRFPWVS